MWLVESFYEEAFDRRVNWHFLLNYQLILTVKKLEKHRVVAIQTLGQ